jgi:KUP system potassium uptake protein
MASTKLSEVSSEISSVIKSLGVVFGDIGTSPLYTLNALIVLIEPTPDNIFGIISLIVWTLILLVFVQYAWLAMSLGKKGEGGTIVLKELLTPLLKTPGQIAFVGFLAFVGIALFIGDGVITPAVSILSAVELSLLIPATRWLPQGVLMGVACLISIFLFIFQKRGTERVAATFGPLMLIWFLTLAVTGFFSILQYPMIVKVLNPYYGLNFIVHHGVISFFVLSGVILCATGGEALYADMGHLSRKPILKAWYFVFVSLILSYLGQGAFLLRNAHPMANKVLGQMFLEQIPLLYVPFVMLGIIATVIASQALISGVYSVVYQGITTGIMPRLKVDYTSSRLRSQIYIGSVNWMLMIAVLFMIINFEKADNLTDAYGMAVTGTMTLTSIMMMWIFYRRRARFKMSVSAALFIINFIFFGSCLCKIPNGAYWSILIALVPLSIIIVYTQGQKRLRDALSPIPLEEFLEHYLAFQKTATKLKGSSLFFIRDIKLVPSYVAQTMFQNNIVYEDNILISIVTRDDPFGVIGFFKGSLAPGIRIFEIHRGYMEMLDVDRILRNAAIDAQVIFYGLEEITTKNIFWKVYSAMKRLVPSFVQFYKLPPHKLHGVMTLVEM